MRIEQNGGKTSAKPIFRTSSNLEVFVRIKSLRLMQFYGILRSKAWAKPHNSVDSQKRCFVVDGVVQNRRKYCENFNRSISTPSVSPPVSKQVEKFLKTTLFK